MASSLRSPLWPEVRWYRPRTGQVDTADQPNRQPRTEGEGVPALAARSTGAGPRAHIALVLGASPLAALAHAPGALPGRGDGARTAHAHERERIGAEAGACDRPAPPAQDRLHGRSDRLHPAEYAGVVAFSRPLTSGSPVVRLHPSGIRGASSPLNLRATGGLGACPQCQPPPPRSSSSSR